MPPSCHPIRWRAHWHQTPAGIVPSWSYPQTWGSAQRLGPPVSEESETNTFSGDQGTFRRSGPTSLFRASINI